MWATRPRRGLNARPPTLGGGGRGRGRGPRARGCRAAAGARRGVPPGRGGAPFSSPSSGQTAPGQLWAQTAGKEGPPPPPPPRCSGGAGGDMAAGGAAAPLAAAGRAPSSPSRRRAREPAVPRPGRVKSQ